LEQEIITKESFDSSDIQADLYEDNKVDFKDFVESADMWLNEQLWPQP